MASGAWTVLIAVSGTTTFGILGLMIVLLIGLVLLLPVRERRAA